MTMNSKSSVCSYWLLFILFCFVWYCYCSWPKKNWRKNVTHMSVYWLSFFHAQQQQQCLLKQNKWFSFRALTLTFMVWTAGFNFLHSNDYAYSNALLNIFWCFIWTKIIPAEIKRTTNDSNTGQTMQFIIFARKKKR